MYRNPSRPDLKCWQGPRKRDASENGNKTGESTVPAATSAHDSVKLTPEQGESSRPVCTESEGPAVINGHAEQEGPAQNGLASVKQERPSTPPPRIDGPGDTNNNIQDKAPVLNTGSSLMSSDTTSSGSFSGSSQHESSKDTLSEVKREEEPLSPIPALVPVGEQTGYMKSELSSSQGKLEGTLNTKSDNGQTSVKPESDKEGTGQQAQLNSSVGSSRADSSQVKAPTSEGTPQLGADSRVKQENESAISSLSTASTTTSEVKVESQESAQSMSDDESAGAINNLLDDITQIQDDLESRMDDIEQQLTGETLNKLAGRKCKVDQNTHTPMPVSTHVRTRVLIHVDSSTLARVSTHFRTRIQERSPTHPPTLAYKSAHSRKHLREHSRTHSRTFTHSSSHARAAIQPLSRTL